MYDDYEKKYDPMTGEPLYPTVEAPTSPTAPTEPTANSYAEPAYTAPAYQAVSPQIETAPKTATAPVREKKGLGARGVALLVVLCLVVSCAFGVGGGALGYLLMKNNSSVSDTDAGKITTATGTATLTGESLTVAEVVAKTADSVVEITTESVTTSTFMQQYVSTGAGSGVILTSDGYIATNNHVIDGANKITVTLHDGTTYDGKLIAADSETDLAVVKIEATGLSTATIGDSSQLVVGQRAIAIGNPLGSLGGTVTEGIISSLDRQITIDGQTMTLLQTSAAVNPGNSGGGLFDEHGYLIGIVNAKSSGDNVEGLGFAIPSNTVSEVTGELIDHGYVSGRVELGVTLIHIADERTAMMYRVSKTGIYILRIEDNSNAANAGLQAGDRLVSVNGTEVTDSSDVENVLNDVSVGDTLSITIERAGETKTVSVLMAESIG